MVCKKVIEWRKTTVPYCTRIDVTLFRDFQRDSPNILQTSKALTTPSSWNPLYQ